MYKVTHVLGQVIATVLAILFIAIAVLVLVSFNLERKLFDPLTYKQLLASQNFYDKVPPIISQALVSTTKSLDLCQNNPIACGAQERSPEAVACFENTLGAEKYKELASNQRTPTEDEKQRAEACLQQYSPAQDPTEGNPLAFLGNLTTEDWKVIISALLPPEDIKAMTDQAFDEIFAFLNYQSDSAKLSVVRLKQRVAGEAGVTLVLQMMSAQPDCTFDQILAMSVSLLNKNNITLCNPPVEVMGIVTPLIQYQLGVVAASIPDEVTLIPAPTSNQNDPRGQLKTVRSLIHISPFIPLGLLFLIMIFAVRDMKGWLNWWGIPLLISGILAVVIGLTGIPFISWIVQNKMVKTIPFAIPIIIVESSNDLVREVISQLLIPVIWQGLFLAFIGMIMILFALFLRRKQALAPTDTL
jgi:hypothetical protein